MKAVVAGMIGTFPVGGVVWDYGQYVLGLEQLGFEVFYLEDNGCWSYDTDAGTFEENGRFGAAYLAEVLCELSPPIARRWYLRAADGTTYGTSTAEAVEAMAEADVFLNVSGGTLLRPEYLACRRKIFIDTDPGWNHFVGLPALDAQTGECINSYREHDSFFTYALDVGRPRCALPTLGLEWHTTLPPVVLDRWRPEPPGTTWTTVLSWDNDRDSIVVGHTHYGSKAQEFEKVLTLPSIVDAPFELAVGGRKPPVEMFRANGWGVVDGPATTRTPSDYRRYVEGSRGEVSVAKNVFVATGSGWFSCRSVCYLAAGRPVVVQDTGFSAHMPSGEGLLAFDDIRGAADAIRAVEDDYEAHAAAARGHAETTFAADRVLTKLLDEADVR